MFPLHFNKRRASSIMVGDLFLNQTSTVIQIWKVESVRVVRPGRLRFGFADDFYRYVSIDDKIFVCADPALPG